MSITLKSITNTTVNRPVRMVLLGVEKIGKSSFASGSDSPIFIPIKREEGIDSLPVPKFPACQSLEDLMECLTVLASEDHNFKTVVIDSASALEPVVWEAVAKEHKVSSIEEIGYGKGYLFALDKWFEIMDALDYLRNEKGMAVVVVGHVKVKRFDDPERESYDQYRFDINDKVSEALLRWADFIGFANVSVVVEKEKQGFKGERKLAKLTDDGQRFLYTKKTPAHPGGGRDEYGRLPDEIPLDWKSFKDEVTALQKQNKK